MVEVEPDFYLPDACWEHVFKFLNEDDKDNRSCLKSVSVVSKRFLTITNRLRSSLTICKKLNPFLTAIFHRFPNLTSITFSRLCGDRDTILSQISSFPFNIISLNLRSQIFIPVNGLRAFSQKIKSVTSLECSDMNSISVTDLSLIADCFPLLEELHLNSIAIFRGNMLNGIETLSLALPKLRKVNLSSHTYMNDQLLFHLFNNWKLLEEVIIFGCLGITNAGIASALCVRPTLRSLSLTNYDENCITLLAIVRSCPSLSDIKIEYFPRFTNMNVDNSYSLKNFVSCFKVKLHGLNFEVPKLEVLNLSNTRIDNEELFLISKSFRGLLELSLEVCYFVTKRGVNHVVENCTQLREINLRGCYKVHKNIVASMISSRPSLRKIVVPPRYRFNNNEREHFIGNICLLR
ncbi:hypothetical protein TSUD_258920 [Trifolium subterraneum]|uniref:Uncharacterized protein n=1 Tax=Trifolium subterraneum TaxID=3900 RepID=A0A2Z6NZV8_TRISU|nr:hypothetical protein TSUD_258920 [Trifolium subterraneum]